MTSPPRGDFGSASTGYGAESPFRGFEEDNPFADLASSRSTPPISVIQDPVLAAPATSSGLFDSSSTRTTHISPRPTSEQKPTPSTSTPPTSAPRSSPLASRRRPTGSRLGQSVISKLEDLDLDSDPLGPLGESTPDTIATPPPPPAKDDSLPTRTSRIQPPTTFSEIKSDIAESSRVAAQPSSTSRQLSMPLEQAAQPPTFHITVGDPTTIGNITGSHTEYKVRTKTNSKAFKNPDFTVNRRYRDFVWLYNTLNNNNPGIVVPPPPEKQQIGRFEDEFVEARRQALERMLNKIAHHALLQRDVDFKLFIESDTFNVDVKQRDKANVAPESKGFMGSIGLGSSSFGGKMPESDEWFEDRRTYVDALETQFKSWSKSIDAIVKQRKDLAEATGDFGNALFTLSTVELDASLCTALASLADLQSQIRELHERQAQQDVITLGNTVDEYIRIVGSIKTAFAARQKVWMQWQAAESDLHRRQSYLEKVKRQAKTQQDRLAQMNADLADMEKRCHQLRLEFDETGKRLKIELDRFEREKVEDFKASVETFLEASVEGQKELIEIWETYLMRMSHELDDDGAYGVHLHQPVEAAPPPAEHTNSEEVAQ